MAVSVAVEAKPEVEIIWRRSKIINFLTLVSYSLLQTVLANMYRFATIQNVTDNRQTTDRQTDRQTTQCAKGMTNSTSGQ